MQRKCCSVIILVLVIGTAVLFYVGYLQHNSSSPNESSGFDNEGRYDSTNLNYMGVIYTDQSDILNWNGGYSESTNCPWGRIHNGLDFAFMNGSTVIAAAPGYVEEILITDTGPIGNVYMIHISIRFNESIQISYVFEPWTNDSSAVDRQIGLLEIEVGDWVSKGDAIGQFLTLGSGAHIHFAIYDGDATCPRPFFSDDAYTDMMTLVHTYQSGWDLCYP